MLHQRINKYEVITLLKTHTFTMFTACPINTYKSSVNGCSPCPANSSTAGDNGQELSGCVCDTGYEGEPGRPCTVPGEKHHN